MIVAYEGEIVYRGEVIHAEIGVDEEGRIVSIKKHISEAKKHVDYSGKLIIPGAVDIHVHFRDPGFEEKEDFGTGSEAALAAGVTTVFDMPNTRPKVKDRKSFRLKLGIARRKSTVDFGIYFGLWQDSNFSGMRSEEFPIKVYLNEWGDLEELEKKIEEIPEDYLIVFHAEHPDHIYGGEARSLEEYNKLRPPEAEIEGIKYILRFKDRKIHVAHVSTAEGARILDKEGISYEVTPHHLLLNNRLKAWPYAKVNPPLRSKEDSESLWRRFWRGNVPIYASDHAPHLLEEKKSSDPPAGIPGVEEALPLMLVFVKEGIMRAPDLMAMYSRNPADLMGIYGEKGALEPGFYADFSVVDLNEERRIRPRDLHYKCGWTLYKGLRAIFPMDVYVHGEKLVERWEVNPQPGFGSYVYSEDFRSTFI